MNVLIREGLAVCTREPRCDFGLEGFELDWTYRYQLMEKPSGVRYLRMWHPAEEERDNPCSGGDCYDCCRPAALRRFFKVVAPLST